MGSCRVVKNPNGNGFTPDSLKSMRDILTNGRIEALKMSRDGEDIPLLSLGIEKMLHKIGDTYHNLDLDKLVPLVEGFLKRLGWDNYIPGLGLYNTMSKKNRHYFETKGSGLQQYTGTGTLEEIKEINRLFLDNTFGSLADIKTEVKLQASNIMINTFIIDRENGNLVLNISEVNKNAREQKLKLFKKVLSYLETKYQDLPQDLYEDGKYTYALQDDSFKIAINELEALLFSTDSARRIEDLYTDSHISEAAKNKYDAAIAWFTLKNFDNFVDTLIGEAFSINPDYRGKMVDEDLYSYADKGHHLITSWTTSDEIILETRINKLALTLINSTPFMTYGSENKSGKYIKFEDYYRIITKIKDLSLNPITTEIAMDSSGKLGKEVKDALSESDWNLIQDKSLRWVINNIRTNPLKFTRIAMLIVNQPTVMAKLGDIFSKEEKDKCWSIYKGIFDPNYKESIKYIQTKADYNSENYYAALTLVADAIYSVNHLQYNDDEGVITLRSLRDLSSDNTRRDLESTILRSNTRRRNYDFQKNELDPYKAQPIKENNLEQSVLKGLSFEIQLGENILQVKVTDMGGTVSYKLNGKSIVTNANFLKLIEEFPVLYKFIDLQLKINFDKDTAFRSNYYNVGGNAKELIDLASIVLLNKYVSNIVFKDVKGPKETTKKLKELYPNKTTRPGYDGLYNEMKIIPDSKLEVLERLAKAKTWTTGEAQSSLVRDAEGDALSTLTLSRLLGALASLFEHLDSYSTKQKHVTLDLLKQSKKYKGFNVEFVLVIPTEKTTPVGMNVNHLTRTISIVENLMLDKYNTKAWTRPAIQKDGSQAMPLPEDAFNSFDEFLNFCLEHEYQHTIHPRKEGLTTGEYETMINNYALDIYNNVTSPVKDFSLLRPGFYKGFANIKELKSPLGNKQHTLFTVAEYIQGEFLHNFVGGFMDFTDYSGKSVVGNGTVGILPSVNSDKNTIGIALFDLNQFVPGRLIRWRDLSYEALAEVTRDELGKYYLKQEDAIIRTYNELQQANPGIPLDYENNFKEFNKYCKKNNVKASDKLFNLTLAYNKKNSLAPIKLIDLIHYIKDGKEIKRNNTIKSLSNRYKNKRRYDDFMKLKELDLLQALTDENVAINLFDSFESETPGSWLRDNYKNWVGKNGHNNGKMTLAKITKGGKSFDIVNKIDLLKAAKELGIDISKNLHNLRDVKVEIHPMLQKWNAFDYLLSQEFLLAGVGSHVAHPAKVKTESPIIWNDQNQLYSKTKEQLVPNNKLQEYKDRILVFNPINEYGISELELLELWEDYKKQANRENKILMTSSIRLKELVKNDFTDVITNPSDGTILDHALEQILDNEIKEEASRFLAQHKRNVSFTAAMHPFQLNQIDGIPNEYNMAVIDDITYDLYTIMGNTSNHSPFDGATFVNPLVVYWENNSLKGDKAGIDKKQFVHYYDEATGTGGIIKTAGFGITNDRAKGRKFYRTMAYNMMKRSWVNPDGSPHITMDGGILKDYMGNTVDYGPVYFKKGSKYFMREIVRYNGDNTYTIIDSEVDNLGDIIKAGEESIFEFEGDKIINSNYDVWQLFGGWNSMEIGENGTLVPSENSLKLTARAANNYGYKKYPNEVVEDASDIVQPMKMSDIHYMPTVGAIKQGAANINPKSMYYNKGTLNHMRVKMRLAGIQLDKEHHADGSVLSLMTLVISAAAAKGYTLSKSSNVYNALYNITKIGTKDFRDQLGNVTTNPEKFDAAVSNIILLTILNSSANDGNLILNIAKDLIVEFLGNKSIKLTKEFSDKVNENVPYSSREIYPKLVTALTSSLTKSGIKLDISGILAVLNPTQDIVKLYKVPVLDQEGNIVPGKYKTCNYGLLENYFDLYGVDNEESLLQTILDSLPPVYKAARYLDSELPIEEQIGSISNIEIGQYYIIESAGLSEVVYVNMPNSTKLKDGSFPTMITPEGKIVKLYGYKDLKEDPTISSIREYLLEGNDLKSYNVRFNGTIGNGEFKSFQIADLDIVQDFFEIKNKKGQEQYNLILEKLKKYNKLDVLNDVIRRDLQKVWELKLEKAISEKRPTDTAKNMLSMINSFYERPYSIYSDSYQENSQALLFLNYIINSAQKVLHRELQLNLNGISKSDSGVKYVTIGGEKVYIDKKSIKTQAYGAIMPKTFKTDLGLELFDDLETIKNNPDFFVNRLALKFTTKVDNYIDYDAEGNEFEVYNFHLELKKTNGRHIYVRAGLNGALLGNKINIHKYTDENGNVFRRDADGNILYALSSINDEVYMDAKGNEIIVTSPDSTIWKDTNGNNVAVIKGLDGSFTTTDGKEIKHIKDNVYYNTVDGVEIEKIETSGLLFYLDNMEYNSLYINKAVNDTEFTTILRRAASSKNSVANNIANKIKRLGSGEKSLKLAIEKQRELSDMLGDYESLLKINPEGPLKEFYHFANNHITKLGRRMHTSFLKTLNIVAARIPALNQLSFMAMEIEAYDNPDINSAYVSTYQFFLLGSDLDIDAVSLLTFTLNKSGLYVGHSPYYNLESKELAEASENLPFPTGEEVKLIESSETSTLDKYFDEIEVHNDLKAETSLLEKILDRNIGKGLFNLFIKRNGEVKLSLNLDYEENIEVLSELLQEKEVIKAGNTFINSMYNNRDTVLTEQQVESLNQLLVDIINKHNLYISKSNTSKRTNIERNWLTRQIYEIISDPINQLEAMSPIDEVTSNAKNLAKKSSKANVLDTFTAGSVANKCLSISENMVGKDGIAVCATGLKSFFALTLLHNTIMGGDDSSAKDALLCNVKIGGKTYNGLANVFTERFFTGEEEYEKENISYEELAEQDALFSNLVKDYLIEQLRAADASNDMSALLSLSTDNAKELVLAKINAGTSTIGMYLYGLSLGIPFDTLYKIMTSKLGFRLAELTKGDTFNNDSGTNDIIGALDYIMLEPTNQISRFDSVDFSEYKVMNPSTLLLGSKTLRKTILGFVDANGKYDPEAAQNYLESLRNKVNLATTIIKNSASDTKEADAVKYTIQYNSLIDFAIQYAEDLKLIKETTTNDVSTFYNTVYGGGNILTDFEILAMGAHEMKLIGKLLRLNQEIKTNPQELIELVANIENALVKRASQIRRYNMRHSDGYDPGKLNEEEKTFYDDIITVRGNAYKSKYKIDFERFITDEAYAINKIKLYDIIKAAYNPLKILHEVAHYKGYAESLYMAYKGWKDKSSKFKLVTEEKSRIESTYNIYDSKLKEQVGRNLENMADTFYRSKWMLRRYKPIVIPASTDKRTVFAFTDSSKEATPIYSNREIQLGTKMGDANFKLWMEEIVIPDLKSRFPNNKFLQDLKFTVNPKTPAGTIATSMGLPINMLPRSEYEKDTFNQYKKSFNDLAKERKIGYKDAKGNEYSAQELLFLYSLITTNGRVSQTSLYGIFEDYMLNNVAKDYHNAISEMDQNSEETISLIRATYTIDDIIPFSTRYKGGSDRFKEFDKETETITVWEKNSYSEDELGGEEGGYRPKYVPAENSAIIKGFNTDYFLTAIHNKDLRQLLVNEQIYPELSQYEVQIEPLLDGSKRLVNIKAKSEENNKKAELYLEYITKKCKGKLPKKISLSENTGKDEDLDYDRINNELKNIECLNV